MKYPLYNQEGKETGEMTLPKEIFEVPMNADLVHQVAISYQSNQRQSSAHTKNRAEVRGGGRKPWRQKGTGRARHGSIRSPLWRGGGVTFGPRNERNFEREIPKKMRKKALSMVLSEKAKNHLLVILESITIKNQKTKEMADIIKRLPINKGSRLVLYKDGKGVYLAARNIAKTKVLEARKVNVADLLSCQYLMTTKDGIKEIVSTLDEKSKTTNSKLQTAPKG